jgi:hypothetical protein
VILLFDASCHSQDDKYMPPRLAFSVDIGSYELFALADLELPSSWISASCIAGMTGKRHWAQLLVEMGVLTVCLG